MHPHIPRPRRKATRTCADTASVVRTVHGEFMWPFTARVNEKTAPIERIAAVECIATEKLLFDHIVGQQLH